MARRRQIEGIPFLRSLSGLEDVYRGTAAAVLPLLDRLGIHLDSHLSVGLAVRSWVRYLRAQHLPEVKGCVAIFAMRNPTWFDWAMYAACWMRRLGYAPIVIYAREDQRRVFSREAGLRHWTNVQGAWAAFEKLPDLTLVELESAPQASAEKIAEYDEFAAEAAHMIAAYELYVEERETVAKVDEYKEFYPKAWGEMATWAARMELLLSNLEKRFGIRRILGYSGMINLTAAMEEAARRVGWTRMWVESWCTKPGEMIWNENGPALTPDYKTWVEAMDDWGPQDERDIDDFLYFQEHNRPAPKAGSEKDFDQHRQYQQSSTEDPLPEFVREFVDRDDRPIALVGPNVIGDSATFGRATIFDSQREWIGELADYFKGHREYRMIIRAHPGERFQAALAQLPVRLGDVAAEAAGDAENILVIPGAQPCSTYVLMRKARLMLNWVSNVGIDAILRDLPTISAGRPFYAGMGITLEPSSRQEYYEQLDKLISGPRETSAQQKLLAKKYLAVLYKERPVTAFGAQYRARDLRLDHPLDSGYGVFYRVLAGELPNLTRFHRMHNRRDRSPLPA